MTPQADSIDSLGQTLSDIAYDEGSRFFRPGTELIVRLEEGSLKGWITVLNITLATYGFVANYKGAKESAPELWSDVKYVASYAFKKQLEGIVDEGRSFSENVNKRFIAETETLPKSVTRTERRTKTPGRILRAYDRAQWLDSHRKSLSKADIVRETAYIASQLNIALDDLSESDKQNVVKAFEKKRIPIYYPEIARVTTRPKDVVQSHLFDSYPIDDIDHQSYVNHLTIGPSLRSLDLPQNFRPLEPPEQIY